MRPVIAAGLAVAGIALLVLGASLQFPGSIAPGWHRVDGQIASVVGRRSGNTTLYYPTIQYQALGYSYEVTARQPSREYPNSAAQVPVAFNPEQPGRGRIVGEARPNYFRLLLPLGGLLLIAAAVSGARRYRLGRAVAEETAAADEEATKTALPPEPAPETAPLEAPAAADPAEPEPPAEPLPEPMPEPATEPLPEAEPPAEAVPQPGEVLLPDPEPQPAAAPAVATPGNPEPQTTPAPAAPRTIAITVQSEPSEPAAPPKKPPAKPTKKAAKPKAKTNQAANLQSRLKAKPTAKPPKIKKQKPTPKPKTPTTKKPQTK